MSQPIAVVGKIVEVSPIEKANNVELVKVDCDSAGLWQSVVRKGDFPVDAFVEVFLQDALLPDTERFAFMEGKPVKVRKMRGVRTECLVMPLSDMTRGVLPGTDISGWLGVKKYSKPAPVSRNEGFIGKKPSFIPTTDEVNVQSNPSLVEAMVGHDYYITRKHDGTSASYYFLVEDDKFGVCSRNMSIDPEVDNIYTFVAKKYKIEETLKAYTQIRGESVCIQGEVIGPKIQGNSDKLTEVEIRLFDIWLIESRKYAPFQDLQDFCNTYDIPMVELISRENTIPPFDEVVDFTASSDVEGVVYRTEEYIRDDEGNRLSFKVLNPNYKNK